MREAASPQKVWLNLPVYTESYPKTP